MNEQGGELIGQRGSESERERERERVPETGRVVSPAHLPTRDLKQLAFESFRYSVCAYPPLDSLLDIWRRP